MRSARSGLAVSLVVVIALFGAAPRAAAQAFIRSFGAGMLNNPRDVAIDIADGSKVFVADRLNHVVDVFTSGGAPLTTIGNGILARPVGVAIDSAHDNLIVTDAFAQQILVFSATATSSTPPISSFNSAPSNSPCGQFNFVQPFGVAVDPATADIVVTDATANRVLVFSSAGSCIASIVSGEGSFGEPTGVAIDPTNGDILVAEEAGKRVQVFAGISAPGGLSFKQTIGEGILVQPARVVVDALHGGNVLVSDQGLDQIQVFSPAGALLGRISGPGGAAGPFASPAGMAFDTANGNNLVVVDVQNDQIDVFTDGFVAVPTLGGWVLLLAALLLGGLGWRAVRLG